MILASRDALRVVGRELSVRPSPGMRFEVAQRDRIRRIVRLLLLCQIAYAVVGIAFHGAGSMADDPTTSLVLGVASIALAALMFVLLGIARSPRRVEAVALVAAAMALSTAAAAQLESAEAGRAIFVYEAVAIVLASILLPWRVRSSLALIGYTAVLAIGGIILTVPDPREANALGGAVVFALAVAVGACTMTWNGRVDRWTVRRRILALNGELRAASLTDALTGLANRRALESHLARIGVRRSGTVAFAIVDVDRFKGINDAFGHQVGDDVLRMVARMIQAAIRAGDRAYRYGGEEFLVVFDEIEPGGVVVVAERIRAAACAPGLPNPAGVGGILTVSVGAAETAAVGAVAVRESIADADRRLYAAKQAGRNRVTWRDEAGPDDLPAPGAPPAAGRVLEAVARVN